MLFFSTAKRSARITVVGSVVLLLAFLAQPAQAANVPGVDWTTQMVPIDNEWYAIGYGNGTFVAVGESRAGVADNVTTSTDGTTWTQRERKPRPPACCGRAWVSGEASSLPSPRVGQAIVS